MTTMVSETTHRPAHIAKMLALVLLFWGLAALLVIAVQGRFPAPPVACAAIQMVTIVAVALAYMKVAASEATIDHALFVGTAWLVLSIVTELAMAAHTGHGWFEIIGSPTSSLRNVLMFAWILAPALFATKAE